MKRFQSLVLEAIALCRANQHYVAVTLFLQLLMGMLAATQLKAAAAASAGSIWRMYLMMAFMTLTAAMVALSALDICRRARHGLEPVHLADSILWGLRRTPRFAWGVCKLFTLVSWLPLVALLTVTFAVLAWKLEPAWAQMGGLMSGEAELKDVAAWGEHVPTLVALALMWAVAVPLWWAAIVACQLAITIYVMEGFSLRDSMRQSIARVRGNLSVPVLFLLCMWLPQAIDYGVTKALLERGWAAPYTVPGFLTLLTMPVQCMLAAVIYFHLKPSDAAPPYIDQEPAAIDAPPPLPTT